MCVAPVLRSIKRTFSPDSPLLCKSTRALKHITTTRKSLLETQYQPIQKSVINMDDDDLYDEFGNFIGPHSDDSEEPILDNNPEDSDIDEEEEEQDQEDGETQDERPDMNGHSVALTTQSQSLGEAVIVDPTQTGRDEPVIKPVKEAKLHLEYNIVDNNLPQTTYSKEYMLELASTVPERVRNVAVVGDFHSGKTALVDMLVMETHPEITETKKDIQQFKPLRYLDTHVLEQSRGVSVFANATTLLLQDLNLKSHVVSLLDCPGHPDFADETDVMLSAADGALLVLDVVEGFTKRDKRLLTKLIKRNLPVVVVLNKIDRLILELRLPMPDFYAKIRFILNDVNACLYHNEYIENYTHEKLLSPILGNVVFSSHTFKSTFSLQSFAALYAERCVGFEKIDMSKFEKLLWGDIYYDEQSGKFTRDQKNGVHSFQHFILEPIYKLVSHTITCDSPASNLFSLLKTEFGVILDKHLYKQDPQILLRKVFASVLGDISALVSLISQHVLSSVNPTESSETLVAEILKLHESGNFLVKCIKGNLTSKAQVKIIDHEKASKIVTIDEVFIPGGRYMVPTQTIPRGCIGLVKGIKSYVHKQASMYSLNTLAQDIIPFCQHTPGQQSFYKVAVEPEIPTDLPRLVEGLQELSRFYISAIVKLEESGEHVIFAPGEMYLDCFLHDLRNRAADYLSIKVSDPMVRFSETCVESSAVKIATQSASKKISISITAEPVNDKRLSKAIELGQIDLSQPQKVTSKILRNQFEWDALAARSLWCFGPADMQNPSMLLDDSLEGETNKQALLEARESICAGFKLGVSEGPLCEEPIRNTKFKILDAVLNSDELLKGSGNMIPTTRNAVHTGFLTAAPRLMEPTYRINIVCTRKALEAVQIILDKRRGWTVSENPLPATHLYEVEGYVPIIDSVGLDTDMRLQTQGQAMCLLEFARWDKVPGDPLDRDCALPNLKPVPRSSMARDFVLKTRRRKGLSGEPSLQKYLDGDLYARLTESGIVN